MEKLDDSILTQITGSAEVKGRSELIQMYKVKGYKKSGGEVIEIITAYSNYEIEASDKIKKFS